MSSLKQQLSYTFLLKKVCLNIMEVEFQKLHFPRAMFIRFLLNKRRE